MTTQTIEVRDPTLMAGVLRTLVWTSSVWVAISWIILPLFASETPIQPLGLVLLAALIWNVLAYRKAQRLLGRRFVHVGVLLVCLGLALSGIGQYGLGPFSLVFIIFEIVLLVGVVLATRGLGRELERHGWSITFFGLNAVAPSESPHTSSFRAPSRATPEGKAPTSRDLADREERECPACAEFVLVRATRCRYCGQSLTPPTLAAPSRDALNPPRAGEVRAPLAPAADIRDGIALAATNIPPQQDSASCTQGDDFSRSLDRWDDARAGQPSTEVIVMLAALFALLLFGVLLVLA